MFVHPESSNLTSDLEAGGSGGEEGGAATCISGVWEGETPEKEKICKEEKQPRAQGPPPYVARRGGEAQLFSEWGLCLLRGRKGSVGGKPQNSPGASVPGVVMEHR